MHIYIYMPRSISRKPIGRAKQFPIFPCPPLEFTHRFCKDAQSPVISKLTSTEATAWNMPATIRASRTRWATRRKSPRSSRESGVSLWDLPYRSDNCHPSNNSPLRETDQFKDWNLSANLWHFSSCSVCNWSRV